MCGCLGVVWVFTGIVSLELVSKVPKGYGYDVMQYENAAVVETKINDMCYASEAYFLF